MLKSKFFLFLLCFPFLLIAEEDDCAFVDHPLNRLDIERRVVSLPPVRSPLNLTYLIDPLVDSPELTASEDLPKDEQEAL
jgi:hypothetical protein